MLFFTNFSISLFVFVLTTPFFHNLKTSIGVSIFLYSAIIFLFNIYTFISICDNFRIFVFLQCRSRTREVQDLRSPSCHDLQTVRTFQGIRRSRVFEPTFRFPLFYLVLTTPFFHNLKTISFSLANFFDFSYHSSEKDGSFAISFVVFVMAARTDFKLFSMPC